MKDQCAIYYGKKKEENDVLFEKNMSFAILGPIRTIVVVGESLLEVLATRLARIYRRHSIIPTVFS